MLPPLPQLRSRLGAVLQDKANQGHAVAGWPEKLAALPDSYDALWDFAHQIADLPLRDDQQFIEPNDLDEIWAQCNAARHRSFNFRRSVPGAATTAFKSSLT